MICFMQAHTPLLPALLPAPCWSESFLATFLALKLHSSTLLSWQSILYSQSILYCPSFPENPLLPFLSRTKMTSLSVLFF
jgi:hypothetical protein